jgi:hypothetical protein
VGEGRKKPTRRVRVVRFTAPVEEPVPRYRRPKTRADCPARRPCPFVGCRYNLFLDVLQDGSVVLTYPGLSPLEVPKCASCALDAAERGPLRLEGVGELLRLTRERVRQIERRALEKMAEFAGDELRAMLADDPRRVVAYKIQE